MRQTSSQLTLQPALVNGQPPGWSHGAMAENKTKMRFVMVITAVITFVISSWLIANWDDFKAGLTGGYESQTKSRP
jgi:hypothetical protein